MIFSSCTLSCHSSEFEFPHSIRTIYEGNDDDHEKLLKVSLSWDAKILLTVTETENGNILKLWQWSVEADEPNGTQLISLSLCV